MSGREVRGRLSGAILVSCCSLALLVGAQLPLWRPQTVRAAPVTRLAAGQYLTQLALLGDGLTPERREEIFWEVLEQTLAQVPSSERKRILLAGTGSWMSTDPNRRGQATDIDATIMYVDDTGNEDPTGAVRFQQMFNANLRAREPAAEIALWVDEADEGKLDFYRGPTGRHFFYTHSKANNPNSAFILSLEESWLAGSRLVKEQRPIEDFWRHRGKDVPEKIGEVHKFVEDNQAFLDYKLRSETDPVKRAVIIAKYVHRVEHWLKNAIQAQWGKTVPVDDPELLAVVAVVDCLRDEFPTLPITTLFDTLESMPSDKVKDKVMLCLGAKTDAELQERVTELLDGAKKYFGRTREQVKQAEEDVEQVGGEATEPPPARTQSEQDLLNCLCSCLEPPGGQFTCYYDTEDRGWSPSCRDLSNGPCICKAYGCFRGPLPTDGECYEKCQAGATATERPGDGNGDGRCTEVDALMALKMAVGGQPADAANIDVNGDGQITEVDALQILKWAVAGGQCGGG